MNHAHPLLDTLDMELPVCPVCSSGKLLPFLGDYQAWICSKPTCAYAISLNEDLTFYKGAGQTEIDDDNPSVMTFQM